MPEQFDLERGLWIIPPVLVKQLQQRLRLEDKAIPPYIVPLSRQAIEIVRQLLEAKPPGARYLLPHRSDPAERVSENTLNRALHRMGYRDQLTGHGIRATISTALHEIGYSTKWIDAQLSHTDPNQVRKAYNHAQYVEQRRGMMQDWADRLDNWESQGDREAAAVSAPGPAQIILATKPSSKRSDRPIQGDGAIIDIGTPEAANGSKVMPMTPAVMMIVSRTDQRPQPALTDIQRERAKMLAMFEEPHNLPLPVFARLAGKSRHQINREIQGRHLLSLNIGNRGQRIPDWQLDPVRQQLIHTILQRAEEVDAWTIYRALSEPLEGLEGRSPVEAVTMQNLHDVAGAVLGALGLNCGGRVPTPIDE
jgi:Phage integrase family